MLAFNHMGRMGQLGNQMFQYASLKGIARNRGFDYMIPNNTETVVDSLGNHLRTEIFILILMLKLVYYKQINIFRNLISNLVRSCLITALIMCL